MHKRIWKMPKILFPLFWSIVSVFFTIVMLLSLRLLNNFVRSGLLKDAIIYLSAHLSFIFTIVLLLGYARFLSKINNLVAIFNPIFSSVAGILIIYLLSDLFLIATDYTDMQIFRLIADFMLNSLFLVFMILLLLGYAEILFKKFK